jgi:hypothetical protein
MKRPNFTKAGKSHPFAPKPDHPEQAGDPSMLEKACASASFLSGLISTAGRNRCARPEQGAARTTQKTGYWPISDASGPF